LFVFFHFSVAVFLQSKRHYGTSLLVLYSFIGMCRTVGALFDVSGGSPKKLIFGEV
jgi:hypothetical protein